MTDFEIFNSERHITRDEAEAMVAAAVQRAAEFVFCRCPVGVCDTRDGTCSRQQRENILSIIPTQDS